MKAHFKRIAAVFRVRDGGLLPASSLLRGSPMLEDTMEMGHACYMRGCRKNSASYCMSVTLIHTHMLARTHIYTHHTHKEREKVPLTLLP